MIKGNNSGLILLLALAFVGMCCSQKPAVEDEKAYLRWLNEPNNGYVKEEVGEDLIFSVKRIPNEWSAHEEALKQPNYATARDSLLKLYDREITFLLTISPKDESKNVMFRDITSVPDFKNRVNELNFNFGQYLKLQAGAMEMPPVLVSFENIYEIGGQRSVLIRFLDETEDKHFVSAPQLVLVWVDEVFWTGVHRFGF